MKKKNKKDMENISKLTPWKTTISLSKVFGNFIRNAVATAADGTFGVFQDVVDRDQIGRLYQVSWNPKVKLHRLGKSLCSESQVLFKRCNFLRRK